MNRDIWRKTYKSGGNEYLFWEMEHINGGFENKVVSIIIYFCGNNQTQSKIMKWISSILFFLTWHSLLFALPSEGISNLRCEYLTTPLGIDQPFPRLTWRLPTGITNQKAYQVIVGTDSVKVSCGIGDCWNSGKVLSSEVLIVYSGKRLEPYTRYYWKICAWDNKSNFYLSDISFFETGVMDVSNWKGNWITDTHNIHIKPAAYFRKTFDAKHNIKEARAYIAVAGLYEFYINGSRIGDHRLDPMYTRFDRRNLYLTHDVKPMLTKGHNTFGVLLGNGWYNHQSTAVWNFYQAPWRGRPKFCMDIRIVYDNGEVEFVSTGADWKTSLSPVIFNSIYTAEHYDARLEQPGWNTSDFDDAKWKNASGASAPSSLIVSQQLHPIRDVKTIYPAKMTKLSDSCYIFDMGRNIAGVSELTIKGKRGTEIRLKHSERIGVNQRADMSNIDYHYRPKDDSDPFQTDIFILNGNGDETFRARFNYKGFQYVEVSSTEPIDLSENSLKAYFMHSDVPAVGKISSSSDLLNKIWEATNSSYLSNLFGYPTDCPQREKNGWTGDAHIAIETALYNFDGITVYEKWLADHQDEQAPNGVFPAIIPTGGWGYHWGNGVDWTSTIAIIPWNIYLFYGDIRLLESVYDNIKRYVDYLNYTYPSGITDWGLGDWIPIKSRSSKELTSSIYYYVDADILAKTAKLLDKKEDYCKYSLLAQKIKDNINARFLNAETGIYCNGNQTELSAPLYWNIVPEDSRELVARNLSEKVKRDGSMDVGLLGSKTILNALSMNGYADLAYQLASRDTYPSWGWWIKNGATTLYENWRIDGKKDISLNHIMFGEISAWFYKALGGIFPDSSSPGFKHIILKPNFVFGLEAFEARHTSPYGEIVSSWKKNKKKINYEVTIPSNCTATLYLNTVYKVECKEMKSDVMQLNSAKDAISLTTGTYHFEIK